jgi:signal transduction histidine kinase
MQDDPRSGLFWLHVSSDAVITLSYYSIAVALFYFIRRRRDLPLHGIVFLFGAFLCASGTVHLAEIWALAHGTHHLSGAIKLLTAIVAVATVIAVLRVMPLGLTLPSPAQLRDAHMRLERWIAERWRIAYDLELNRAELERRVEDRTAELQASIAERRRSEEMIQAKNRELETLLYVTSHDLREPLRAIENFSHLVNRRYAERLDEKGRDLLDRLARAGRRMQQLLDDLLALSRVRRVEFDVEPVEGRQIVDAAIERLNGMIRRTGAELRVADDLPRLGVDRTWATQAVYNLLTNALKFTRPGESPRVEIAAYRETEGPRAGVGIVVRDRGPGVDPRSAERIFDLFQRAVGREIAGTGAGLAIVREVAQRFGGQAWVEPRSGGGSEFVVTFGVAEATEDRKEGETVAWETR